MKMQNIGFQEKDTMNSATQLTTLSLSDTLGVKTPMTTFPCPCLHTQRKIATLFISFIALAKAETARMALVLPGSAINMLTSFM